MSSAGANIATIVGSDKGGVGKSLISSLLIEAYDQVRRPLSVIEIDHQAKLRSIMGGRVDLSLKASADLGEVTRDRHTAERFYNPVYDMWQRHDSLTDLGANVTTSLFDWMNQCHIRDLAAEDGVRFRFVAVTTPDDQALRSAFNALSTSIEALDTGSGDDLELFLVLNEIAQGKGFAFYENHHAFRELMALAGSVKLKIVKIPYCDSDLMDYGRAKSLSPLTVFKNNDRLCEEMELSRVAARTEKRRLLDWISDVQTNLEPLFVPFQAQAEPVRETAAYAPRQEHRQAEPAMPARHVEAPMPVRHAEPAIQSRHDLRYGESATVDFERAEPARHDPRQERHDPRVAGVRHVTDAGAIVERLHDHDDRAPAAHRLRPVAGTRFDGR